MSFRSRVLAAALCVSTVQTAHATQEFDLRTGVDFSTWSRHGAAQYIDTGISGGFHQRVLSLTLPTGDSAGAAFSPGSVLLNFNQSFGFDFHFFMAPGNNLLQGDGMTFVIAGNNPATNNVFMSNSPTMNGAGGSNLGYGGSGSGSHAFAIDTFHFQGEPVSPSIQILSNGFVDPVAFTETGLSNIRDPNYFQWHGRVSYAPSGQEDETGTLMGTINQFVGSLSYTVSAPVDWSAVSTAQNDEFGDYLGRNVYFGFTAGNGAAMDGHFITSITPVPEAPVWVMILAGVGLVGGIARRRAIRGGQSY